MSITNWTYSPLEAKRFVRSRRLYLETSAFNFLAETIDLPDLELTRAFQRRKGAIFVTSPMLLWEIMLISDRDRADRMLLAAQALFDPVLLATPTELTVRFLHSAYPNNVVNYPITTDLDIGRIWRAMTDAFERTFDYDLANLIARTKSFRSMSKNLVAIIEGRSHEQEIVRLASEFVTTIYVSIAEDIEAWGMDEILAKFVILYAFILLMAYADLDSAAARQFWIEKGFDGPEEGWQVTRAFVDYPYMFRVGPILTMAGMAAQQYRNGPTNRGALFDGMHMVYSPYVDAIISNDRAFLDLANNHPYFRQRTLHISELDIRRVSLPLSDYPDDQKLRPR